ncbi:butyrophilin subfamily 2 member A1-like [Toxotes jaculatrix]|uniref:butyrophilin subfamily 2 member A1-like n=1 Tax=Toxotes jaculatrix TaxID=941984 RepID=UPI001B3AD458|nr:butyrophilin subfamily 2 member A1-like [Toxotes jaculatrix]
MDLRPVYLWLLAVIVEADGPGANRLVVVVEGSNATLPCSLITQENIESELFDWRKDRHMEVFLYDRGSHYNKGRPGQDDQFKGRVSHFEEELKHGNASIVIRSTKVADSGNYTCDFPHHRPRRKTFYISLVVNRDSQHPALTERSGEISGAAPKPYTRIVNVTKSGVLLMCEVLRAYPMPTLEWQDSDGNVLPAEQHVSERGGYYSVSLLTTVNRTKTKVFHCAAKQEAIGHMTKADIYVPFCGEIPFISLLNAKRL